jgi:hypothetical protein
MCHIESYVCVIRARGRRKREQARSLLFISREREMISLPSPVQYNLACVYILLLPDMFSLQSSSLCKRIVRAVSSAPVSSSSFAPLSSPFFFARQQQRSFSKRVYSQYRVFGPGGTPAEEQIVMAFRIKPPTLKQSTHYSSVQYRGSLDLEFTRKSPATQQFDYNSTVSTRLTMDGN